MVKKTDAERMAVMETKIDNIETTQKSHGESLKTIETKLDHAIACKADRSEVNAVKRTINRFIIWALVLLLGVIGYLVDKLYITK